MRRDVLHRSAVQAALCLLLFVQTVEVFARAAPTAGGSLSTGPSKQRSSRALLRPSTKNAREGVLLFRGYLARHPLPATRALRRTALRSVTFPCRPSHSSDFSSLSPERNTYEGATPAAGLLRQRFRYGSSRILTGVRSVVCRVWSVRKGDRARVG